MNDHASIRRAAAGQRHERARASARHGDRRGSAYVLVLGTAMLVTVIGMSVVAVGRVQTRVAAMENDAAAADALAESAVEWGLVKVANDVGWRTTYSNNVETATKTLGRGTISFKIVDDDGSLSDDANDTARLYGIGRVGKAVRIYSVSAVAKGTAMDVLSTAAHGGGAVSVSNTVTVLGGPLSSNGTVTINSLATLNGNVAALLTANLGTLNGTSITGTKVQPSSTAWDIYYDQATDIPYASIASGAMTRKVLSPASNPFVSGTGALNAKGVYHVTVPALSTLTVTKSRLVCTLMVTLETGATFTTSSANHWVPAASDYPALIVKAFGTATVQLSGNNGSLLEALNSTNYNPPGTPYPWPDGAADTAATGDGDIYPSEINGLLHITGSTLAATTLSNYFTGVGTVITNGSLSLGSNTKMTLDANLRLLPPAGYTNPGPLVPVSGTWRSEKAQ